MYHCTKYKFVNTSYFFINFAIHNSLHSAELCQHQPFDCPSQMQLNVEINFVNI